MNSILKKSDAELKNDVLAELKYQPAVDIADIGVLVKNGTVTLNGFTTTYGEKWDAVRAAKRVAGVRGLADDIEVRLPNSDQRNDGDIAAAAANQIAWSTWVPTNAVKVTVSQGWVTLEGKVEWWYQKNAAENLVRYLTGVKGVSNQITVESKVAPSDVEAAITSAFKRNALLDAKKIQVETSGSKVVLRGTVRSYAEREEAEQAAWSASGVNNVEDHLTVVA